MISSADPVGTLELAKQHIERARDAVSELMFVPSGAPEARAALSGIVADLLSASVALRALRVDLDLLRGQVEVLEELRQHCRFLVESLEGAWWLRAADSFRAIEEIGREAERP